MPDLANRISTASYTHTDRTNLAEGVQPFLMPLLDPYTLTELHLNIVAYDTIMLGATAQLTDLAVLQAAHKVHLPCSILQATHQFRVFRILLQSILGAEHPLTTEYTRFVQEFEVQQTTIEQQADTIQYPAQLVRWVQLRVSNWFNRQYTNPARVLAPNLTELFDHIENEVPWKPSIPGHIDSVPLPSSVTPTAASTISQLTSTTKPERTRVPNPHYHSELQQFKDSGISLGKARENAKLKHITIPRNDKGMEVCLSYHVLSFCWETCARAEDHREHNAKEHKALMQWCKAHYT